MEGAELGDVVAEKRVESFDRRWIFESSTPDEIHLVFKVSNDHSEEKAVFLLHQSNGKQLPNRPARWLSSFHFLNLNFLTNTEQVPPSPERVMLSPADNLMTSEIQCSNPDSSNQPETIR